jgi:hypothetical protein
MPTNIIDYVKVYNNFIDLDLCDSIVNSLDLCAWEEHTFYDPSNGVHSKEKELSVTYDVIPQFFELQKTFRLAISQYITKDFSNCAPWFNGWEGFTHLRFNKYNVDTKMALHCDHVKSIFDGNRKGIPILSVVAGLNNNYTGGDFIMWNLEKIQIPKGSIMIFPSNFMYPHCVSEVTSGTRYTCVSWVW